MNRRNNKRSRPNDILGGLDELLDAWMDMMQVIPMMEPAIKKVRDGNESFMATTGKPKHQGTMSYEERKDDIVFTIDMPGVDKKDIDINVEDHAITVKARNGGYREGSGTNPKGSRNYNYNRNFKPTVDINSAKATFKNGVLDITLTKIEEVAKGKSVKIK